MVEQKEKSIFKKIEELARGKIEKIKKGKQEYEEKIRKLDELYGPGWESSFTPSAMGLTKFGTALQIGRLLKKFGKFDEMKDILKILKVFPSEEFKELRGVKLSHEGSYYVPFSHPLTVGSPKRGIIYLGKAEKRPYYKTLSHELFHLLNETEHSKLYGDLGWGIPRRSSHHFPTAAFKEGATEWAARQLQRQAGLDPGVWFAVHSNRPKWVPYEIRAFQELGGDRPVQDIYGKMSRYLIEIHKLYFPESPIIKGVVK